MALVKFTDQKKPQQPLLRIHAWEQRRTRQRLLSRQSLAPCDHFSGDTSFRRPLTRILGEPIRPCSRLPRSVPVDLLQRKYGSLFVVCVSLLRIGEPSCVFMSSSSAHMVSEHGNHTPSPKVCSAHSADTSSDITIRSTCGTVKSPTSDHYGAATSPSRWKCFMRSLLASLQPRTQCGAHFYEPTACIS
jgi:hypothetical protein